MKKEEFLRQVTASDIVLTANRRLAVYLQKNYDFLQNGSSHAWNSLQVLPLQVWLETVWDNESNDHRCLLNEHQEVALWQQCIIDSPISNSLLNVAQTAYLLKDTWQLINNSLLTVKDFAQCDSLDVQTFIQWAIAFKSECEINSFLSRSEIGPCLIQKLQQAALVNLPNRIFFVGFDDLTPATKKLQDCLKRFVLVENVQLIQGRNITATRTAFSDSSMEVQEMALWAYDKIINRPDTTVGCVIPNLTKQRSQVINIFNDVFYAQGLSSQFSQTPFNISAGESLNNFPIIQTVLTMLSLNEEEIRIEDLCSLFHSPFLIGGVTEQYLRANLDVSLRARGEKKIMLRALISSQFFATSKSLQAALELFQRYVTATSEKKNVLAWAIQFQQQLTAMGWPGERTLDSTEFQLVERFKKSLSEFVSLSHILGEITFEQAFTALEQLINKTLFQTKSEDQPIQILGVLEASGLAFDYLWVAGLDNEIWPPACSPNPFIPFELQKKLSMPHATSDRELHFSKRITQRLIENSNNIIFSHAEFDGDRPLAPSPLISHISSTKWPETHYASIEQLIFKSKAVETYYDEMAPAIEGDTSSGGSWIFKSQAACPFQAFATYRLNARPFDSAQLGLASHERGSLVHEILAEFWLLTKDYKTLVSYSDDELESILVTIIINILTIFKRKKPYTLQTELFQLEVQRLRNLLLKWLQLEKNRQPFQVIACEKRQAAQVGNLNINVQIDRIDQLEDGSHLIIDYKTGRPSIADWFNERPGEPQLPLYSSVAELALSGILFAQIKQGELTFKGITAYSEIAPGAVTLDRIKEKEFTNLPEVIQYWQHILCQLSEDFSQGVATVNPKDPTTCQYCELQELCRIRYKL